MSESVRVYVPTTLTRLASYVGDGGVGPTPIRAHAVTEVLRGEWSDGSEEEWEYAALMAAAEESTRLLGDADVPRRVVLAADVELVSRDEEADEAATFVNVDQAIGMRLVAAVHADTDDLEDLDRIASEGGPDLAWFATQEISDLLALG